MTHETELLAAIAKAERRKVVRTFHPNVEWAA